MVYEFKMISVEYHGISLNILVLCHSLPVFWVECLAQNGLNRVGRCRSLNGMLSA